MSISKAFEVGYKAGQVADSEMEPFDMSQYADDFQAGFAMGFGDMQGFRMASPSFGASESGRLARLYRVTYEPSKFARQYYKDGALRADFISSFETQAESEAEQGEDDDTE